MPDTPDVATLTPEQATAELARLTDQFRGSAPAANPTTPAEAQARLNHLTSNREFAERFAKGDVKARREFDRLTQQIASGEQPLSFAIETVDAVSNPGALPKAHVEGFYDVFRDFDLPPEAEAHMRAIDSGSTDRPTAGDREAYQRALDRLMKNDEFRSSLLAGDHTAKETLGALCRVIAYAADDGKPASPEFLQSLRAHGLL
jgi:hypothetical protein